MTDAPRSPGSDGAPRADEETVRALLRDQLPAHADRPLVPGPTGWDNAHWLLGDELAVRLPRRELAVPLAANEARVLPLVGPSLPLAVPVPLHVGSPAGDWPWPWSVIPWFDGERADLAYPPAEADEHAAALGSFLAALHLPAPDDAPRNPFRGIPLADRSARTRAAIDELAARGTLADAAAVLRDAYERGVAAPGYDGPPTWIHADLHPGNQLVADGVLTAVVDWGDCASGDPATDLATAWWTLPVHAHQHLRSAYGGVDDATWTRAAAWAAAIAAYVLREGPTVGDPAIVSMAQRTVSRLAASA